MDAPNFRGIDYHFWLFKKFMNCLALGNFGAACLICFLVLILVFWGHLFHIIIPKLELPWDKSLSNKQLEKCVRYCSTQQLSVDADTAVPLAHPCRSYAQYEWSGVFLQQHALPFSLQEWVCLPLLTLSFRLQFVAIVADMTRTLTTVCCFWQYSCCMDTAVIQHFRWPLWPQLLRCSWWDRLVALFVYFYEACRSDK